MNKDFITFTYIVAANILLPTEIIPAMVGTAIILVIFTETAQWKTTKQTTEQ